MRIRVRKVLEGGLSRYAVEAMRVVWFEVARSHDEARAYELARLYYGDRGLFWRTAHGYETAGCDRFSGPIMWFGFMSIVVGFVIGVIRSGT